MYSFGAEVTVYLNVTVINPTFLSIHRFYDQTPHMTDTRLIENPQGSAASHIFRTLFVSG